MYRLDAHGGIPPAWAFPLQDMACQDAPGKHEEAARVIAMRNRRAQGFLAAARRRDREAPCHAGVARAHASPARADQSGLSRPGASTLSVGRCFGARLVASRPGREFYRMRRPPYFHSRPWPHATPARRYAEGPAHSGPPMLARCDQPGKAGTSGRYLNTKHET